MQTRSEITSSLRAELNAIQAQIKAYPMPIPACDTHFNWLLEQRSRLARELAAARASPEEDRRPEE